jgi:hypothetical protein
VGVDGKRHRIRLRRTSDQTSPAPLSILGIPFQ